MIKQILWLLMCYTVSQSTAVRELQMIRIITANTYYSSDLITLGYDANNGIIFGGDLSYEFLSRDTTDIPKALKLKLYNFGLNLRQEYTKTIGKDYCSEKFTMYTSEFPVSMITGLLINAGLWKPTQNQTWTPKLMWQPVPYEYEFMDQDTVLLGTHCPNFKLELIKLLKQSQSNKTYEEFVNYVKNNTELIINNHVDILQLYEVIESMMLEGKSIPSWAQGYYQNRTIFSLAMKGLEQLSITQKQKYLNGGTFLKKVLTDFQDVVTKVPNTKIMTIFSGDDINIAGILANLKLKNPPEPMTQLALIFELYFNNETNLYEVALKSQDKRLPNAMKPLMFSTCGNNCTFEQFQNIIAYLIPEDSNKLCGQNRAIININESETISVEKQNNFANKNFVLDFSMILLFLLSNINEWFIK